MGRSILVPNRTLAACFIFAVVATTAGLMLLQPKNSTNALTANDPATISACADSSECFAFTIDTRLTSTGETTGTTKNFAIPTSGFVNAQFGHAYDWIINWGDGTPDETATGSSAQSSAGITHNYAVADQYQITIRPNGAAASGWMNAFGFYSMTTGANAQANKDKFYSIDTPFTDLMQTKGASYRFSDIFFGARNAIGIPDNLFANITTTGDTDFSHMFFATFANFAYNSTTATIPVNLFDFLDTSSGTNFADMFARTFAAFAYNSEASNPIPAGLFTSLDTRNGTDFTEMFSGTFEGQSYKSDATIPSGLFDSLSTSNGTNFYGMFQNTFFSYTHESTSGTIPEGLFDSLDTSNGTDFGNMFYYTFRNYAYNSTIGTIPDGLFDHIDTSNGTNFRWMFYYTFSNYANAADVTVSPDLFSNIDTSKAADYAALISMYERTLTGHATRTATFMDGDLVIGTPQRFSNPYAVRNTLLDFSEQNTSQLPGHKVVPAYFNNPAITIVAPDDPAYAEASWYRTDGTSCNVATPTVNCGKQDETVIVSFPNATEWTDTTDTRRGNVVFYAQKTYDVCQWDNSILAMDNDCIEPARCEWDDSILASDAECKEPKSSTPTEPDITPPATPPTAPSTGANIIIGDMVVPVPVATVSVAVAAIMICIEIRIIRKSINKNREEKG